MSRMVAIVGRPNVGKSTLFNRLTESKEAIVHEQEGVTRDRIYGKSIWNGVEFSVIDTGGYIQNSEDVFAQEISKQVILAIEEADVIYFMVDIKVGLTKLDEDVTEILRKSKKPVAVIANKVDNAADMNDAYEVYTLGFDKVFFVSSQNGSGTGEMLDYTIELFDKNRSDETKYEGIPKFAIVGKPNVGKSSFLNALVGEERNIVTPIAGTTRDSIDTLYQKYNKEFVLIDTAGLRRRSKEKEAVEFYSVLRTIKAIENADVCFLLIDVNEGVTAQDMNIFHIIQKNRKGVVILVNKWDLVDKESNTMKEFENQIKQRIQPFDDVPIIFVSALNKQRIFKAIEIAEEVYNNKTKNIKTSELNVNLLEILKQTPPPMYKGKDIKVKYITQLKTPFPAFVFFCNLPQYVKDPYKRFVENQLRKMYNFTGVPMEIYFRQK